MSDLILLKTLFQNRDIKFDIGSNTLEKLIYIDVYEDEDQDYWFCSRFTFNLDGKLLFISGYEDYVY